METWQDLEQDEGNETRERALALWQALEEGKRMPEPEVLRALSGLLDESIARAGQAWRGLPATVRREIARTLRQLATDDVTLDFSALFRIALDDTDGEIREVAIRGLDEVDDVRLVPIFIEILQRDAATATRAAAADALGKYVLLGELEDIRPKPFNAAALALRDCYLDTTEVLEVRRQALEAVAFTEQHGVQDLIAEAYEHADEGMRISAVLAMGRSASQMWGSIVQRELVSANPDMRLEATRACGELQWDAALKELVELAEDVDQRIRTAALKALGQIGGKVAEQTLAKYTSAEDDAMRDAAEDALQELAFFSGDLSDFFSPPGASDDAPGALWHLPGLLSQDSEDEDYDDDLDDHEGEE